MSKSRGEIKTPNKHYRADRLAQKIQKDVDETLLKRVHDPCVQNVTITGVDVTGDLQQVTIYYNILSDLVFDAEKTQTGLDKATGLVRSELGTCLNISKIPEIKSIRDLSITYDSRVDQSINDLHKKGK